VLTCLSFMITGLTAQQSKTDKALKLIKSYQLDSLPETLDAISTIIDEVFEEEEAYSDPMSLYAKTEYFA